LLIIYSYFGFKNWRYVKTLQKLIIIALSAKVIELLTDVVYYILYNYTADANDGLRLFKDILAVGCQGVFLSVQLIISMGWSVSRARLVLREKQLFWGAFMLYLLFDALYTICEQPQNLCAAYMLSFHVIKFF